MATATRRADPLDGHDTWPGVTGICAWLVVLVAPASDALHGRVHPAWLAGAGLVAYVVLFVWLVWLAVNGHATPARRYAVLALLAALGITLMAAYGTGWYLPVMFLAVASAVVLPPPAAVAGIVAALVAGWLLALAHGTHGGELHNVISSTGLSGFVSLVVIRLFTVIAELQATREELARAAVEQERLRFARDLHDLLGHTLSLIVVKAEAVRRLAARDPAGAAAAADGAGPGGGRRGGLRRPGAGRRAGGPPGRGLPVRGDRQDRRPQPHRGPPHRPPQRLGMTEPAPAVPGRARSNRCGGYAST
jgi:two-component system sensor histidine kinase DesK